MTSVCLNSQILFSGKKKSKKYQFVSAEFNQREVHVMVKEMAKQVGLL